MNDLTLAQMFLGERYAVEKTWEQLLEMHQVAFTAYLNPARYGTPRRDSEYKLRAVEWAIAEHLVREEVDVGEDQEHET